MSYQSLYRTYRPSRFDEIVGQDHIKQTLQNAIKRNQLAHAYLFCGPRGTGKTSVAKIFAKAINCLNKDNAPCNECEVCLSLDTANHPDIIEIDAASNNGVDEIRDLIDKVKYAPIELTYKVYIIDEVHMLTQGAFNALLKTLEEPPQHVIFILATTEVHKVLPTIISRCQRYDFERVSQPNIIKRLTEVFSAESIAYEDGVLELIASLADGGMRDALTIAEQVISYAADKLTDKDVRRVYKIVSPEQKLAFIEAILSSNLELTIKLLNEFESESIEFKRLVNDLVSMIKEATIYSLTHNQEFITTVQLDETVKLSDNTNRNDLIQMMDEFLKVGQDSTFNGLYQEYLEIAAVKLCASFTPNAIEQPAPVHKEVKVEPVTKPRIEVEPEITKPVIVGQPETVKPMIQTQTEFDQTFIIECMVLGNKQLKQHELTLWPRMKEYTTDVTYRKVSTWLSNSTIAIADEDFVVLVFETIDEANFINDLSNRDLVREVTSKVLETEKKVAAISKDEFDLAVSEFRRLYQKKQLPTEAQIREKRAEAIKRVETETQITNEPTSQELIQQVFGDALTIIE